MRSIGSRITVWYALITTATLACLFVAGHYLLQNLLIAQLDALNEAQYKQLKSRLGPDYKELSPQTIDERIRQTTESGSALFYIDMHTSMTDRFFRSQNLRGQSIPDIPGLSSYTVEMPGIGELRVSEYQLPPFEVILATPMAPLHGVMAGYRKVFFVLLVAALLLCVFIGYFLSQFILTPVRLIQATANRIRSDNLSERIPVANVRDELSQLARFLNQMFDRLEHSFSEIRRFSAEASHELKTPLSLVRLHAERLLVEGNLQPAQVESVHVQLEEIARVNHIIDELLFLSRADAHAITMQIADQHPQTFLAGFAQDAQALAEYHGKRFAWRHEGEGTAAFEAKRIRQVLLNLVSNAVNASPEGGLISLASTIGDGVWRVSVEDEGEGLSAEQRAKIFDRFVRFNATGANEKGSGLGLAISRSIVQLHRGRIFATEGDKGRGLRVIMELESNAAPGDAPPMPASTAAQG